MTDFNAIINALVFCDTAKVTTLVNNALAQNTPAFEIRLKFLWAAHPLPSHSPMKSVLMGLQQMPEPPQNLLKPLSNRQAV